MSGKIWTFADFEPGHVFGTMDFAMDESRLHRWSTVFGEAAGEDRVPQGVLLAVMMEAYLKLLQPRPPGNIHASQELHFTDRPVRKGEIVRATLACRDKYQKKDRFWVVFEARLVVEGEPVMTGVNTSIWAA